MVARGESTDHLSPSSSNREEQHPGPSPGGWPLEDDAGQTMIAVSSLAKDPMRLSATLSSDEDESDTPPSSSSEENPSVGGGGGGEKTFSNETIPADDADGEVGGGGGDGGPRRKNSSPDFGDDGDDDNGDGDGTTLLKKQIIDLQSSDDAGSLDSGGMMLPRRNASMEFGDDDDDVDLDGDVDPQDPASPASPSSSVLEARTAASSRKRRKTVHFSTITVREYKQTVGVNPFCSYGCPISLDWEYEAFDPIDLIEYETTRPPKRSRRGMLTSYYQRRDTLLLSGHTPEQLERAAKESGRMKFRRSITITFLPIFILEEKAVLGVQYLFGRGKDKSGDDIYDELNASISSSDREYLSDVEEGKSSGRGIMRRTKDALDSSVHSVHRSLNRSLSLRHRGNSRRFTETENPDDASSQQTHWEPESHDDLYVASRDSNFDRYRVRVDHNQHDKSSEIRLCNLSRPHMRAFHASWFSFFVAFFMWFAITPLLGEVKATLNLSKEQIWTSSLCGTAGTIIMRIIMGPLCDKFGARICMASVLLASAIPCAMTGLVETSQGLSTVRAFVGIAGASFVACQYWTSSMFTREVAGTANALVAGWGNLGGGVTQVIMGSVIFPLLKYAYGGDSNENSAEQAWRTSFVIPATVAIIVAICIIMLCDDSPKGDYRARVRAQEVMIASPCGSLSSALSNWNAWALMFQYACCFGVEVTMTNATALYFKERFGQSTETAAAIASIFGFMNLFARGLGGLGSDTYNTRYGMRGRLGWQFVTLFVQGAFIVAFAFARTMTGAIFALIFTSIMVQSAEGSTFGIVPYVSRRYTGGIVGFVGAGGNVGGVMFAAIFRAFHDEKALYIMGAAASLSSFLSFTIKMKGHTSFVTCIKDTSCRCSYGGRVNNAKRDIGLGPSLTLA